MIVFALRRLATAVPLLLATSFIVFSFVHLAPGNPVAVLVGGRSVDEQTVEAIKRHYHLNESFLAQYWHWLGGVVSGNFGQSIVFNDSVSSVVSGRIVPTLELAAFAFVIVVLLGLLIGIVTAVKRDTPVDTAVSIVTLAGSSMSAYVSAILLVVVFSVTLGWFPVFGLGDGFGDRLYHLTLPAIALALSLTALVARVTRASMGEALEQEYVETARSRGFSEARVVLRHALRNAFIPVLTISGLVAGYLISGAVLVEYTFGLNGLGSLLVKSVQDKDFAVVQSIALIFTVAFLVINLAVDLLYGVVDPRVRLRRRTV